MLNMLKGSPWAKNLGRDNVQALLNFLRGGAWYYYKGYRLPCLDRGSYVYNPTELSIPYAGMLDNLIGNWMDSFTPEEQRELLQLQQEVKKNRIMMEEYAPGIYSGTRWFFNNDDLIKKTPTIISRLIWPLSVVTDWRVPPVLLMPTISIRRME